MMLDQNKAVWNKLMRAIYLNGFKLGSLNKHFRKKPTTEEHN